MFSPNSRACTEQLAHAPPLYGVATISMVGTDKRLAGTWTRFLQFCRSSALSRSCPRCRRPSRTRASDTGSGSCRKRPEKGRSRFYEWPRIRLVPLLVQFGVINASIHYLQSLQLAQLSSCLLLRSLVRWIR